MKKALVEPQQYVPYLIFVCLARSAAELTGVPILAAVKNAAKLAVYDEIIIRVKNHQIPATILVDTALNKINNYVYNNMYLVYKYFTIIFLKNKNHTNFHTHV